MAMDLNKVMIIGRITKTPELRTTPSGQSVTSFNVATNRQYTDASGQKQEKAEFHSIVAWGKLAEICCQYLTKGRRIFIEGRLQTRDWVGQDGLRRYATEIIADNMIMLDGPAGSREQRGVSDQQSGMSYGDNNSPIAAPASQNEPIEQTIEEIPF